MLSENVLYTKQLLNYWLMYFDGSRALVDIMLNFWYPNMKYAVAAMGFNLGDVDVLGQRDYCGQGEL